MAIWIGRTEGGRRACQACGTRRPGRGGVEVEWSKQEVKERDSERVETIGYGQDMCRQGRMGKDSPMNTADVQMEIIPVRGQ